MAVKKTTKKSGLDIPGKAALTKASGLARKRAFRKNSPVAISVNGVIFILFPDKSRVKATPALIRKYFG